MKKTNSAIILFLTIAALFLIAGVRFAEAKEVKYLNSVSETPETTAYFNPITEGDITHMDVSSRVGVYNAAGNPDEFWYGGTVFYLNENEYGYFSVNDAVTLYVNNLGTTVDGKQLDGSISFSVEGRGTTHTTDGLRAVFLVTNCHNERVSWACASISATQDWKNSGLECAQTTVHTTIHLYEHVSGAPFSGRLAFYVDDLDVGHVPLPEQVRIMGGFADDVYVSNQTELNRGEIIASGGTHFVATTEYEPSSFKNGFVAYIDSDWADFYWSGTSCETEFGSITETYPVSKVTNPKKTISSIDGKAPEGETPDIKRGQTIDYSISQSFPYTVSSNAAREIVLSDVFDERLDLSNMSFAMYKEAEDEKTPAREDGSRYWNWWRENNKIVIQAKDPLTIGGTFTFECKNLKIKANTALGPLSNKAHVRVSLNNSSQGTVEKDSNEVRVNVVTRYEKLVVTKHLETDSYVKAHGIPTFFLSLTGTKNGKPETFTRVLTFDENVMIKTGDVALQVTFDLTGFDGDATLSEKKVLRYHLQSIDSPNADVSRNGDTLIFHLAGGQDSYTLSAEITNKKVFQEKTSDTVCVLNEVKP